MRKLLIGLALSVMATVALADWVLIETINGDRSYADPLTISRTGNIVRMYRLDDLAKPSFITGQASYSAGYHAQYDCAGRTLQILQMALFSGRMLTGEVLLSGTQASSNVNIVSGTITRRCLTSPVGKPLPILRATRQGSAAG
jgi:hypothetical protein